MIYLSLVVVGVIGLSKYFMVMFCEPGDHQLDSKNMSIEHMSIENKNKIRE